MFPNVVLSYVGEARCEQAEGEECPGGQSRHHHLLQVTCWNQVYIPFGIFLKFLFIFTSIASKFDAVLGYFRDNRKIFIPLLPRRWSRIKTNFFFLAKIVTNIPIFEG
jgi:hypothetical protein